MLQSCMDKLLLMDGVDVTFKIEIHKNIYLNWSKQCFSTLRKSQPQTQIFASGLTEASLMVITD